MHVNIITSKSVLYEIYKYELQGLTKVCSMQSIEIRTNCILHNNI